MKNSRQDIPAKRHNAAAKQLAESRKEGVDEKAAAHAAHTAHGHSGKEHGKKHANKHG